MIKEEDVLARIEGLSNSRLRICIEQSWVVPAQTEIGPVFDELDVARLRLIVELIDDLAVNEEAVPIILSLIDTGHGLNRKLRLLEQAIAEQESTVREKIAHCLKASNDG
ncbi:MAG: chaperone modulator CbpM [Alphaproteobacteria bacterium]